MENYYFNLCLLHGMEWVGVKMNNNKYLNGSQVAIKLKTKECNTYARNTISEFDQNKLSW